MPAPDGSPRLVLASRDLVGAVALVADAAPWLVGAALLAAAAVALAAWTGTRAALRPVDRMRGAAAALPPGARLPVPPSGDELAGLAEEINALLARRDDAVERLERFTGEAAHELRSPIAALRAQADVAVAHPAEAPDPATWRAVAREAERLSTLVADLLALARADAGERMPARPVDLVDAVGDALARLPDDPAVAVTLWAPVPVAVAATPAEVAVVLDNVLVNARRHARTVVHVSVVPAGSVGAAARRRRRPRRRPRGPGARVRPLHPPRARRGRGHRARPGPRRPPRRGTRRHRAHHALARPRRPPGRALAGRTVGVVSDDVGSADLARLKARTAWGGEAADDAAGARRRAECGAARAGHLDVVLEPGENPRCGHCGETLSPDALRKAGVRALRP